MAGQGYVRRGYTTYNEMEPRRDDWNKASYEGYDYSDHVCRPVIVDSEGRKKPIVCYTPADHNSESHATGRETTFELLEHVVRPTFTEYKYSSPAKVAVFKDYGANNDKWRRPSNPVRDRPQELEEFLTKVQYEVDRPTRTGPLSSTYWRNGTNATSHNGSNTEYGEYRNLGGSDWNRPGGNTIQEEIGNGYYPTVDVLTEPTAIKKGGGERLAPSGWITRPSHPLTTSTNDIGEAVELLKDAVKSSTITTASVPQTHYTVPFTTVPKKDTYTETIDSREAARRYAKPFKTREPSYTGTIDSGEAMRKYKGSIVP